MNFFTMRATPNWLFAPLKLSAIAFGILLGTYFHDFWRPYLALVWLVFIAASTVFVVVWLKA